LGGIYRGCENFWGGGGGTPFWGFIAFLLTSLVKIYNGGSTFIPPAPPPPHPLYVHLWVNHKINGTIFFSDGSSKEDEIKQSLMKMFQGLPKYTKLPKSWFQLQPEQKV
jgi:hypothetical protein